MELRLAVIIATLYVVLSRNVTGRTALFCTQMHAVSGIFPLIFPLQLLHLK